MEPLKGNASEQLPDYAEECDAPVIVAVAPVNFVFIQCDDVGVLHILWHLKLLSSTGRGFRGNFLLCWAQGLLDFTIHPLDVARVCCQLNLGAELKPVVIGATPGILLDFAPGHPEDLQLAFAGAGFVRLPRRSASCL